MDWTELTLENFRTFRRPVTLPLAGQGLVLARGRNMVSASCGDNGVGKTGLIHGLSWALYGKDLDGNAADEVACRFTKEPCVAQLHFGNGKWILRARRPSSFSVHAADGSDVAGWSGDAKDVQARLDQLIGFGHLTFRNALVFGQGSFDRFATADPADQMRIVDELQGLDLRPALKRTTAWRDEWKGKQGVATFESQAQDARREQAERHAAELVSARAQYRDGKALRVKAAETRLAALRETLATQEKKVKALEKVGKETKKLEADLEKGCAVQKQAEQWLVEARSALLGAEGAFGIRQGNLERLEKEITTLGGKGTCPTCRAPIKAKVEVARVQKAFEADMQGKRTEVAKAGIVRVQAQDHLKEMQKAISVLPDLEPLRQKVAAAQAEARQLAEARLVLTAVEDREADAVEEVQAERAAKFEGEDALAAAEIEAKGAEAQKVIMEALAERCVRTVRAAEYWVEAFGPQGIRLMAFDGTADYLNERIAAHLATLTAGEATVELAASRTLKSGAVRDKFSLVADWAWGAGAYKGASEGQRRRVDLALFLALQDAAEARSAQPFPLKVFDEPESHLDARGKELFAEWVQAEAARRGTAILITHSQEMADMVEPSHTWTVVLERDGARVEVE